MATQLARRPRFLAQVPDAPTVEAARFSHTVPGPTSGAAAGPSLAPPPSSAAPAPPPPDLTAARRDALERVAAALDTLRAQADRLAEQARSDALEIGFQVARRILEAEIRQSPDALFSLVRSAVRRAGESRRVAVRLAPEDAAIVQSESGRRALDGLSAARIEIFPDAALQRGDCAVDTDFGQVDGRLGTRLAELRRAVDASAEGAA